MKTYDADDVIKQLDENHIKKLLSSFGADCIDNYNNNTICFNAICHSKINSFDFKSHTHNLVYYIDTKTFTCFSGCCKKGYNIYSLIKKIFLTQENKELNFSQLINFIGDFCELEKTRDFKTDNITVEKSKIDFSTVPIEKGWGVGFACNKIIQQQINIEEKKLMMKEKQEQNDKWFNDNIIPYLPSIDEEILLNYRNLTDMKKYCKIWMQDGISKETMNKYNIKYSINNVEIVIPHYDQYSRLVGVRCRRLNSKKVKKYGKYGAVFFKNSCLSHQTSKVLYGLDKVKKEVIRTKKIILVESEKSVLQFDSQLPDSSMNIAVAVCGSSVSMHHLKIIKDIGVEEVIIAFDKEFESPNNGNTIYHISNYEYLKKYEDYIEKKKQLCMKVNRYFDVRFIQDTINNPLLDYKDSPTDKGINTFFTLYNQSTVYKRNELKYELL